MTSGQRGSTYVVIPAFNEGAVVSEVVAGVVRFCPDVVVVDDGSRDGTGALAEAAGAKVVQHAINLGQGAALQTGITYALGRGCRYVVTFDADGQHDPQEIPTLIEALERSGAAVALGSRFKGAAVGISGPRRLALQTARWINFFFTGLRLSDAHNGLRAFTREAAARLHIRQSGMAHATEIIAQVSKQKLSFVEVPVTIRYTDYSVSKGQKLSNSLHILLDLLLRGLLR